MELLTSQGNENPGMKKLVSDCYEENIKELLRSFTTTAPDLYLVSSDGFRVETHSLLLCLVSPLCRTLLSVESSEESALLSLPASKEVIQELVNLLLDGEVRGRKEVVSQVLDLANILHINVESVEKQELPLLSTRTVEINGLESIKKAIASYEKQLEKDKSPVIEAINDDVSIPSVLSSEDSSLVPDDAITETEFFAEYAQPYEYPQGYNQYPQGYNTIFNNDYNNGYLDESLAKDVQKKKSHPCPDCGKVFSRSDHMRRHQRSIHMAYSPFQCDLCPRSYARADKLKMHRKMHDVGPANLFNYSCHMCSRWFASENDLMIHMKSHQSLALSENPLQMEFIKGEFTG